MVLSEPATGYSVIRDFHDRMVYRLRSWFRKPVSTPDPRPGEDDQWADWPSIPSEDQPAEDGRTP